MRYRTTLRLSQSCDPGKYQVDACAELLAIVVLREHLCDPRQKRVLVCSNRSGPLGGDRAEKSRAVRVRTRETGARCILPRDTKDVMHERRGCVELEPFRDVECLK